MPPPSGCRLQVHAQQLLRLILQLAHLVLETFQGTHRGEQVLLVVERIEHGQSASVGGGDASRDDNGAGESQSATRRLMRWSFSV